LPGLLLGKGPPHCPRVADWLDRCGRRYLAKTLSPELHEEILSVCPIDAKGQPRFAWDANRLRADASLTALRAYAATGAPITAMSSTHQAVVDDLVVNLYQWCARARWLEGRGALDPSLKADLEQIPGWVWSLREAKSRLGTPIVLPPGIRHGRPHTRNHYGCPCRACDAAAREFQTAFERQQTLNLTSGWILTPTGASHAKSLMAANPWAVPLSVAAAACIPRSLLGAVLADPRTTRVPPWIAHRLETLTAEQVRAWHRQGSRGRDASRALDPGDPTVHRRLLTKLRTAGWKDAHIGSALGYRGSAAHATRLEPSSAVVHALEQLHRSLSPSLALPSWLPQSSDLEQTA